MTGMEGMGWGTGLIGLLVRVLLVLAIADTRQISRVGSQIRPRALFGSAWYGP
jgi:hypothetical protein